MRNDHKLIFVKLNYLLPLESCEMKQLYNFDKWNKWRKKVWENWIYRLSFHAACVCTLSHINNYNDLVTLGNVWNIKTCGRTFFMKSVWLQNWWRFLHKYENFSANKLTSVLSKFADSEVVTYEFIHISIFDTWTCRIGKLMYILFIIYHRL